MHLAQIKSDERRKKILNIERHLTKDSCLCDACYRHVDRKVCSFSMIDEGDDNDDDDDDDIAIYRSSFTFIYLYNIPSYHLQDCITYQMLYN